MGGFACSSSAESHLRAKRRGQWQSRTFGSRVSFGAASVAPTGFCLRAWGMTLLESRNTKPTHPAWRGFCVLFDHTELTQIVIRQQRIERLNDTKILCSWITSSLPARRIASLRTLPLRHLPDYRT